MGALGPFVDIHGNAIHQMHGNPRFLPWHRIYLLRMEELLKSIHNSGHNWVSGSMGSILNAPCDPVFWMHHAEIDRLWWVWQQAHAGQNPPLAGAAATMDPWTENHPDTRVINALGFTYV